MQCLVVDDDAELRQAVADHLGRFGIGADVAADGAQMRAAVARTRYDVVLLDLMLPDEDGLALCQWLRRSAAHVGVIMLTAQGDPTSRVVGLELGADDYVAKPFEPRELVARVKALGRRLAARPAEEDATVRRFAGWTFDTLKRELLSPDGVLMPLSNAEFRLLRAFVEHPRRVLSRDRLIDYTRGPTVEVSDRSIDLAVSRLRQKLGTLPSGGQLVTTVRGEGYLFDPDAR
jgi:two-component system OmpR family response regulator